MNDRLVEELREIERLAVEFDSEVGLTRLEKSLGLPSSGEEPERLATLVAEVGRKVEEWEALSPSALIRCSGDGMNALFRVIDKAEMSSFMSGMLPATWWGRLVIQLDEAGLVERLNAQFARDTYARMAQKTLSEERRMGGKARHANDPKAAAKVEILELWKEWKLGKHKQLRTVEHFAGEALRRFPVLKSADTIRRWSAKWTKEAKAGNDPSV